MLAALPLKEGDTYASHLKGEEEILVLPPSEGRYLGFPPHGGGRCLRFTPQEGGIIYPIYTEEELFLLPSKREGVKLFFPYYKESDVVLSLFRIPSPLRGRGAG